MNLQSPPTVAAVPAAAAGGTVGPWYRRYQYPLIVVAVIALLLTLGGLTAPEFLSPRNLLAVVRAASIVGIVALGLTFVTISGNYFSLSIAQTAVLGSVLYASLGSSTPFAIAFGLTIAVCIVVGLVQGAIVSIGGNPVVVTLAAGAAILGIVLFATDSVRVRLTAPADSLTVAIGRSAPLGIPMATWAFIILAVLAFFLLQRSALGRRTMLVGANKQAAVATGMNVRLVIIAAFCLSSVAAALAGILTAAEFGVADTAQFPDLDINAVAAVLVGGTAIKGGQGSIIQTCVGALFIALLRNYLQIIGLSMGVQLVFVGAAVVIAVAGYSLLRGARS